jgi:hypothetical protein
MDVVNELADLFLDVDQEHRDCTEPMAREYWQGKKDGLRTALALLNKENADHWRNYQESSHNRRLTKLQTLTEMVNDAVYYIGEVLWWALDGGDIHPTSVLNMEKWFDRYKREAERGNVPVADDTCYSE